MHLKDGELRAYLDREASTALRQRVEVHLAACSACRQRQESFSGRSQRVAGHLARLEPAQNQAPLSTHTAHARFQKRIYEDQKEHDSMLNKLFNRLPRQIWRLPRPAWAALILLVLLAGSMAFSPVRAIANSFLGLFRVQQLRVVQINPSELSEQLAGAEQFEMMLSEDVQFETYGEPQKVASPDEASQAAGFNLHLPAQVQGEPELTVQPGGQANLNVDLQHVQLLLSEIGRSDIQLPAALDGAQVTLDIGASVTAQYGDCEVDPQSRRQHGGDPDDPSTFLPTGCTTLVQMLSPSITAPPGLDIASIGQAYLQVMGMSPEEAASFSNNVDWTTTLVIPIPRYGTDTEDVMVDGVTGTLIHQRLENPPERYMLLWVKDGMLYALAGTGESSAALEIANSLQ